SAIIPGSAQAADVPIVDTNISREHCKLFFDDDRLRIEDSNSANGTFINSKRLGSGGLKHGDTIRPSGAPWSSAR
ncbi:MAG: pSer/pThr/pTyr-binding forkhead associated (FHA) protein, partial [Limisphaerales bacterium]